MPARPRSRVKSRVESGTTTWSLTRSTMGRTGPWRLSRYSASEWPRSCATTSGWWTAPLWPGRGPGLGASRHSRLAGLSAAGRPPAPIPPERTPRNFTRRVVEREPRGPIPQLHQSRLDFLKAIKMHRRMKSLDEHLRRPEFAHLDVLRFRLPSQTQAWAPQAETGCCPPAALSGRQEDKTAGHDNQ